MENSDIQIVRNKNQVESNLLNQTIFPIFTNVNCEYECVGTGFFINQLGWFLTAKHVLFYREEKYLNPLIIAQWIDEEHILLREADLDSITFHDTADIAIGMLKPVYNKDGCNNIVTNPCIVISSKEPNIGEFIKTYAFPASKVEDIDSTKQLLSFTPISGSGNLIEVSCRNDVLLKGKCYETSLLIDGGASGGPAFDSDGKAIGINTTGYRIEGVPISFITPIDYVYEIEVRFEQGSKTVREIAALGGIIVR